MRAVTVGLVAFLLVLVAFLTLTAPNFMTVRNASNVLQQMGDLAVPAAGATFIIVAGGLDLSVGAIAALSGVVAAFTAAALPGEAWVGWLTGLAVGLAIGAVNGQIVTRARINPLIATLGTLTIVQGIAFLLTGGQAVPNVPTSFGAAGQSYLLPQLPVSVVVAAVAVLVAHVGLSRLKFGRYVYAIGGNAEAARLAGLDVNRIKAAIYALGGVTAAVTGVMLASRLGTGDASSFNGYELTVITAVVLGGSPITGGEGSVFGTVLGVAILAVLDNGMVLLNVSPYTQFVVQGAALLVAVGLGQVRFARHGRTSVESADPLTVDSRGLVAQHPASTSTQEVRPDVAAIDDET